MIVDASAVIAIVLREPGAEELAEKLRLAEVKGIGAPTLVEAGIVLTARLGDNAAGLMSEVLRRFDIRTVSFGEPHWREALSAYVRYGKGRHPARLNFGDCMSYAVAKLAGSPLLFTGDDFTQTDVPSE